ncbi:MAG: Uncharacterized protein K0R26_1949 [Bacteroidota bacterium]|jgi:integrative and conjugative element protein (TIGR02256 family)|nr:Uncharacterized protein [Bacteroidota bacterium]
MVNVKSVITGIKFSEQALGIFASEIEKYGRIETGGVLIGRIQDGVAIIEKATNGGPNATHKEFFFQADPNYVDMIIDMEFANSDGKNVYLGEWHTHPQTHPQPSPKDLRSLDEIADTSEEFAILLILGAIDFNIKRLPNQYYSIIKYKEEEDFFHLILT